MDATQESTGPSRPFVLTGNSAPLHSADRSLLRNALEQHGALLLRGFDSGPAGFAELCNDLCSGSMFNESPGREIFDERSKVQSVNLGGDPFPLHPELAREPWRPDLAAFACFDAPDVGGQTNICDGIAIAESLPDELRAELGDKRLFYIRPASPQALEYWLGTATPSDALLASPPPECPYWFRRAQGQVVRGFTRPVLEPTLFDKRPAFANFVLFARDYLKIDRIPLLEGQVFSDDLVDVIRSIARSLTYSHRWQEGDVILLDNSRFMHGRKAIVEPEQRRIATYFGYLKGVEPREGEPTDPVWRRTRFVPPDVPPEN